MKGSGGDGEDGKPDFVRGRGGGGRGGPETELVYLESYIITLKPALNKFHKASGARLVGG